jgi:hypothetical protein
MAKQKEQEPKVKKQYKGAKSDLLKVSKGAKVMAAYASLRGFSYRQTIKSLGEAEHNYKLNGRLVHGGKASKEE